MNNISKISNLAAKMASMGFQKEADEILALAKDQQLNLFKSVEELPEEESSEEEEVGDRFDLDGIDFEDLPIPDDQVEPRKKIISVLLREHPGRSKQDIIDEVIKLPTDSYSFEYQTRNYRQAYPELNAELPAYISPRQVRMPGVEPNIRFMPDEEETTRWRKELERYKEEYPAKVKELREKHPKEKLIEELKEERSSYHGADWEPRDADITWRMQSIIDKELERPKDPEKIKIDTNISPELYKELEEYLREAYDSAKLKADELHQLVNEAMAGLPPEPPPASPESFTKLDQYIEDLKYRIYYNSYRVLSESARYTVFGASTGDDNYYNRKRSDLLFFSIKQEEWIDDPELLKDYMEKTPQAEYMGYRRATAMPREWARNKKEELERYEESIDRAINSYKRGLRFLKRLNRMLDKEIENRFSWDGESGEGSFYNKEIIRYIEKYYKDELDVVYQKIINSLEGDVDAAARKSYYSTEHTGAFIQSNYYGGGDREAREDRGFSMFDIEALFHNKIKMYEVINNFASLILTMINRTIRNVRDQTFLPIVKRVATDVHKKLIKEMTGFDEEDLFAIYTYKSDDPAPIRHPNDGPRSDRELRRSKWNIMKASSDQVDQIFQTWLEFNKDSGIKYQSMVAYPRFVIKDPKTRAAVESNFKRQIVFGLIRNMAGKYGDSVKNNIANKILDLLNASKIKVPGKEEEEIYQSFLSHSDVILDEIKREITNKFQDYSIRSYGDGPSWESAVFADESEISDEYKELIYLVKQRHIWKEQKRNIVNYRSPRAHTRLEFSEDESRRIDQEASIDAKSDVVFALAPKARHRSRPAEALADSLRSSLKIISKQYLSFIMGIGRNALVNAYKFKYHPDLMKLPDVQFRGTDLEAWYRERPGGWTIDPDARNNDWMPYREFEHKSLNYIADNLDKFIAQHPLVPEIDEDHFYEFGTYHLKAENSIFEGDDIDLSLLPKAKAEHQAKIKKVYDEYIFQAKNLNQKIKNLGTMFGPAAKQIEVILYTSYYSNIFKDRMLTFGNVGPRGITGKYRGLNKRLRTKDLPYKPLVKAWEKQLIQKVDGYVDDYMDGRKPVPEPHPPADQTQIFYSKTYSGISSMEPSYAAAVLIAKKLNITEYNMFEKIIRLCHNEFHSIGRYQRNFGYNEFKKFVPIIFDDHKNLQKKIVNLYKISDYAHNRGADLPMSFFKRTIKDPNFKNLGNNVTVGKYFSMCAKLARFGGLAKIKRDYKDIISVLLENKMLSRGFYTRLRNVYRICRDGVRIRPNLEGLEGESLDAQMSIRQSIEETDTDLTALEDYSAFEEYNKLVVPKDKNLFKLNWEVKPKGFRFRVFKTYDPRHFKVGTETSCCQRLGGIGEKAAIDSYVNPVAGVVVLELFADDGSGRKTWNLATQSYFHYVPRDNGYILDNVETNWRWAEKIRSTTGYSAENLYAMLAKKMQDTHDIKYFLSGTGYSKISGSEFKKHRLSYDPRDFAWQKYTDWRPSSSLDLLRPNFDLPEIPKGKTRRKRKEKLSELYRQIILTKYSNNNDNHSHSAAEVSSHRDGR
jgi:hypothetical protein